MSEITTRLEGRDGGVLVVGLPEGLTHETADPVRLCVERHLPNREGAALVLDMGGVRLVTSLGVAALLQIQEFCRDRGAPMRLAGLSARLEKFFGMLGLDGRFERFGSVDEAVASLGV